LINPEPGVPFEYISTSDFKDAVPYFTYATWADIINQFIIPIPYPFEEDEIENINNFKLSSSDSVSTVTRKDSFFNTKLHSLKRESILITGSTGSGKTTIINNFLTKFNLDEEKDPFYPHGVNIELDSRIITVMEEVDLPRFTELNNCYFSTAIGVISIFQIGVDSSYEKAKNSLLRFKEEKEKYFENFYGLLIGTKGNVHDESYQRHVNEATVWIKEVGVKDFLDVNSLDSQNSAKIYDIILNLINCIISDLNRLNKK